MSRTSVNKWNIRTLTAAITAAVTFSTAIHAFELEEIIVTATKRSESLQDVPIAVTAMDQRTIEQAGITDVGDISQRTPGFTMGSFTAAAPRLYIRGIGSNERGAGGGEPSVAMFIDGIYINRASAMNTQLFDLASVEVLRGAQGTLWGKNAAAGVVNMKTRAPSKDDIQASLKAGVGNFGTQDISAFLSGPLSDDVAGKLTVGTRKRGDYMGSVLSSDADTGEIDAQSVRGQLTWQVSDTVDVKFSVDYGRDVRDGVGINSQLWPDASFAGEPMNFFANLQAPIDFHETFLESSGFQEMESSGASIELNWDLGESTFTSITAHRKNKENGLNNMIGTSIQTFPVLGILVFTDEDNEMFSQELRLSGGSESLTWQTGLYYFNEQTHRIEGGEFPLGPGAPDALGVPSFLVGQTLFDSADQHNETDSFAVFGELTWSASDRLDLTFGARYTEEEKDYSSFGIGQAQLFIGNFNIEAEESWTNPTYKAVANYHTTEDSMVYLSIATGFKSGGWRSLATSAVAAETPFDEENATNYELGLKTMLFDNTVRLNGALFRTDYNDLQVQASVETGDCVICPVSTVNAGEALIQGLELELAWAASEELQLLANYAYLDSEYDNLPPELAPFNGNQLVNAPEKAYNLVALYETTISNGGEASVRYEYIYQGEAQSDIQNQETSVRSDYDLTNLRFGYTTPEGDWEVAAWVNNVFDEEWLAHVFYNPGIGSVRQPALPRTYGLSVTWRNF